MGAPEFRLDPEAQPARVNQLIFILPGDESLCRCHSRYIYIYMDEAKAKTLFLCNQKCINVLNITGLVTGSYRIVSETLYRLAGCD